MSMDPEVREQLRASETTERKTERQRRWRARRKAETNDPVYQPRLQNPVLPRNQSSSERTVDGPVLCGHCKRMFADATVGAEHVKECPVRNEQTAAIKRGGECCICMGKKWSETPCGCSCHYPEAPAWTMTKGGYGLPLHKHRDTGGRCDQCGAERG